MKAHLDFGYPWWLSYGHLTVLLFAVLLLLLAFWRKWSLGPKILISALLAWSAAAFVVARFLMDINGRATMPTENVFRQGQERILDLGAGTGRSSIMVLEARPQATLVALDLFGDSFKMHFGPHRSPEEILTNNLKAAGVAGRASIQAADMRKLPFRAGEFDGIVSAYAVDHLGREGISQTLQEAARVLKPGGEFLLILIGKDPWLQFSFGPLLMHAGARGGDWWDARLREAGFQVVEQGMRPATLYLVGRKG